MSNPFIADFVKADPPPSDRRRRRVSSRTGSLNATITRTLLLVAATVAIASITIEQMFRSRDAQRLADWTAIMLAQSAAAPRSNPAHTALDDTACRRLVTGALKSAMFRDASGVVYGSASQADDFTGLMLSLDSRPVGPVAVRNLRGPGRSIDLRQIDVTLDPASPGSVPIVASFLFQPDAMLGDPVGPLFPLAAVGLASAGIGIWLLRRRIVQPLESLAADFASAESSDTVLSSRRDELGELARVIADLQGDASVWRNRAEHMERQLETNVATQTREIFDELQRVRRAVLEDPLTGLRNRRAYEEKSADIFEAQRAARADLALVLFDVDRFKLLNDTLGHHAGDKLLRFIGLLLQQFVRQEDLAIRLGGDEFLLLLPGVSHARAEEIANRVVALFGQYARLIRGIPVRPALSAGVASLDRDQPRDAQELLAIADRNMYAAKHQLRLVPDSRSPAAASPAPRPTPASTRPVR